MMNNHVGVHIKRFVLVEFLALAAREVSYGVCRRLYDIIILDENVGGVALAFFHTTGGQNKNCGQNGNDAEIFSHFLKF